ncbi:rhamnulokinase, partial [candidate division NPL-UPA2 bacterium]|nr:rhamnulokinase [candidate division NPL-UPA2 bacterium]
PIEQDDSLRWDFNRLFSEVKTGLAKAAGKSNGQIAGIGVDSWGVDFGLIDEDGKLIENPYHYRDSRTSGVMEKAFELMPKRSIYKNSGLQFMQINSLYQLLAMRLGNSEVLARARKLIFMADLISYHLCGQAYAEYTLASTSQLLDMKTGRWSKEIFNKLGLPIDIMPKIVAPGTVVGKLKREITDELGCGQILIIAAGSHDTASAVAAVPAEGNSWAYISSGTWSLMGVEIPEAIINDKSFEYEFTNEGGVENTIRLLKNIMGLWLVQECRRKWKEEKVNLSYGELTAMAQKAKAFIAHIDPDYNEFLSPGDMPAKINGYLTQTGQKTIDDKGQLIRAILESLAFRYRLIMERIEDIMGETIDVLHIVGGGIKNELLCQFAANATGKKVITGPAEATASGNIIMQAMATGQIKTLAQGRELIRNSFEVKEYLPQDRKIWEKQYRNIGAFFDRRT